MESRKGNVAETSAKRRQLSSPLPNDYLKMVVEVFTANFDEGLKLLREKHGRDPSFEASGWVYHDEIVLGVSLTEPEELAATTVYASVDFDPKASAPTAEDLLSACVDAIGTLFGQVLDPKKPEMIGHLVSSSLSAFENIPFEWAKVELDRFKVFLKMDKSNPRLDQLADDWLAKNDPKEAADEEEAQDETSKKFVTGPKDRTPPRGGGSGMVH